MLQKNVEISSSDTMKLYTYEFNDLVLTDDQTLQSTICMFRESKIIEKFKIPLDVSSFKLLF